jgi:hypothetical protein
MQRCSMRLPAFGLAIIVCAVAGCAASTSYEEPPPPVCETEEGLLAAEACRAVYSCCTRDCENTKLRSGKPGAIQDCMAACAKNLEDCYRAVE